MQFSLRIQYNKIYIIIYSFDVNNLHEFVAQRTFMPTILSNVFDILDKGALYYTFNVLFLCPFVCQHF